MMAVKLRSNSKAFVRGLADWQRRQIPFAAANAMNDVAVGVQVDIVESMKATFDRPTPFTLHATYVRRARKTDLTAFVGIREFAGKGTPAWKYLDPDAVGGPRGQKRFERRLQGISGARFAVPGRGAQLDAYGNLARGQLTQVLSALGGFADTGQNISAASSGRRGRKGMLLAKASPGGQSNYFVARAKATGRPLAVYRLKAKGEVEPVLLFRTQAPNYRATWPVRQLVRTSIARRGPAAWNRAWAAAQATARR